jgi:hypothetical protein
VSAAAAATTANPNGGRQPTVYELLREIDKRYEEQFKAGAHALEAADKRYEQRFLAQENALQTALVAQEKAVTAALAAADRAVTKAEAAAEKRFDSFSVTLTEKIDGLLKSRDNEIGGKDARTEDRAQGNQDRTVLVSLIVGIAVIAATFIATHH